MFWHATRMAAPSSGRVEAAPHPQPNSPQQKQYKRDNERNGQGSRDYPGQAKLPDPHGLLVLFLNIPLALRTIALGLAPVNALCSFKFCGRLRFRIFAIALCLRSRATTESVIEVAHPARQSRDRLLLLILLGWRAINE